MNTTDPAQTAPTIIEIEIVYSYFDDNPGSITEGRSHTEFRVTSNVSFGKPFRSMLGFRTGQPEKVKQRDGKYTTLCALDPFAQVRAIIAPFQLILDNLGDGQMGCYIRVPLPYNPAQYRMEIQEQGKQTKEIDELIEVEENKRFSIHHLLVMRAVIRPSQKIYIEEIVEEAPQT